MSKLLAITSNVPILSQQGRWESFEDRWTALDPNTVDTWHMLTNFIFSTTP